MGRAAQLTPIFGVRDWSTTQYHCFGFASPVEVGDLRAQMGRSKAPAVGIVHRLRTHNSAFRGRRRGGRALAAAKQIDKCNDNQDCSSLTRITSGESFSVLFRRAEEPQRIDDHQ